MPTSHRPARSSYRLIRSAVAADRLERGFGQKPASGHVVLSGIVDAIRTGLRWNLDVPFAEIVRIERADPLRPSRKGRDAIRATLFGAPIFVLHLRVPLVADGPYGRQRKVERVGFTVDEEAEFLASRPARRISEVFC